MNAFPRVSRSAMARRVAADIPPGAVINLGIGMPELVGNFLPAEHGVIVHVENGVIGSGPVLASLAHGDTDLINAGRKAVMLAPGGHFVDHADSFALIRGGHLDITVLGAFQVSVRGDLANWSTGRAGDPPSPGGAMDLAVGARQVLVMMDLFDKQGRARLVPQCELPLTAAGVVRRLYTDVAVFEIDAGGLRVCDLAEGWTLPQLRSRLGLDLQGGAQGIATYAA